jgi:hypothetical protein
LVCVEFQFIIGSQDSGGNGSGAGLPDFSWYNKPMWDKNVPKLPQKYQMTKQNIKISQMTKQNTKISLMDMEFTKVFHTKAFKYAFIMSVFGIKNKQSGNPDPVKEESIFIFVLAGLVLAP